jgi:chromosome partitioning protein
VLLVDLDPQACLTFSTGTDPNALDRSLYDVFVNRIGAAEVLIKVRDLHVLPSSIDVAGAEVQLLMRAGREYALSRALERLKTSYDVVLIDCPPSLGVLTINGLTSADQILIPLQCETLGQRGVEQLLQTVDDVRSYTNPKVRIRGVIPTMFDSRTRLGRTVLEEVRTRFGLDILEPPVPKSVRVAEAPASGHSVVEQAGTSASAEAYRQLAALLDPK